MQPNYTKNFLDGVVAEREKMKNGLPYTEKTPNHNFDTRYIYNSLNKAVVQKTPDAGISKFWYDQVGRQAASQNANQAAGNAYTYTKYDDLGRIVQTSQTTLSQLMVQKQDYAYTLQGWIKGVNPAFGGTLANGTNTAEAFPVAQDAYGFSLHYFDNDYNAIGYPAPGNSVLKSLGTNALSLYNGNIAAMAVNIPKLGANRVYNYHYDQLNRIVAMDAYNGLDISTGAFTPGDPLNEYKERISYDPNGNILSCLRNGDAARQSMDNLTYHYTPNTNQLHKVTDVATDASADDYGKYNDIKQGQADDNYEYDLIGNLEKDHSENIEITWTVFGKIASINKSGAVTNYVYDAAGNRILKKTPSGSTAYVRDGSGNVLSVYTKSTTGDLTQSEVHLYGSSRLGMVTQHETPDEHVELTCGFGKGIKRTFTRGEKLFELNNHLGNVLATVTDKRIASATSGNNALIDHYEADIASAQDYYPFGMMQPGRKFNAGNYRYGFNGKENDNDVKGEGNQQDYGMRVYDPRIGKFLSEDPITNQYPELTPYQFASNRPIDGVDLDGKEWDKSTDPNGKTKITGNVNLDVDKEITSKNLLSNDQIEGLKMKISDKFNTILKASNSNFSGEVTYNKNSGSNQVVPGLSIYPAESMLGAKGYIAGSTSQEYSGVNILNQKNQVRPLDAIAEDAVHELLHTLRITHPFDLTQGNDVKLYGIFKNDYATPDFLRTGIPTNNRALLYNIMNYNMIAIDGINLGNLWKQNPQQSPLLSNDQLSLVMHEIDLQKKGFGNNIKIDETGGQLRQKYYHDYWNNTPGTAIRRTESLIKKAFIY